jgi:putative SOS response-associated peptidase YedK
MCGRYVLHRPIDELRQIFAALGELPNFEPSWNIAPTQSAPVLRRNPATGARQFDLLRWRGTDGTVIRSFAILTTTACPALAHLHERMAVVLEPEDWPVWLGETPGDPIALLHPSKAAFRVWKVGPRVGNVRNNDSTLLDELVDGSLV